MNKLVLLLLAYVTAGAAAQATPPSGSHGAVLRAGPQHSAGNADAGAANAAGGEAGATLARIQALIGKASCSGDTECRTLALGSAACGGPMRYLAWSAAETNESALRALGDAYREQQRAAAAAGAAGRVSNCRYQMDPGATCRAGACVPGGGDTLR
jgi:hypothetical protein